MHFSAVVLRDHPWVAADWSLLLQTRASWCWGPLGV